MITNRSFAFIALLLICCSCATIPSSRDSIDRENASLPKVLIIGDSISLGYTPFVIEGMANKAIVTHHEGNAGPTMRGIENIESWLDDDVHYTEAGYRALAKQVSKSISQALARN